MAFAPTNPLYGLDIVLVGRTAVRASSGPFITHKLITLASIAECESGGRQYNADGSVKRGRVNPNDTGLYQINKTVWGAKAKELGYDILTEEGNIKMANWIYDKYETKPWNASKKCWNTSRSDYVNT